MERRRRPQRRLAAEWDSLARRPARVQQPRGAPEATAAAAPRPPGLGPAPAQGTARRRRRGPLVLRERDPCSRVQRRCSATPLAMRLRTARPLTASASLGPPLRQHHTVLGTARPCRVGRGAGPLRESGPPCHAPAVACAVLFRCLPMGLSRERAALRRPKAPPAARQTVAFDLPPSLPLPQGHGGRLGLHRRKALASTGLFWATKGAAGRPPLRQSGRPTRRCWT